MVFGFLRNICSSVGDVVAYPYRTVKEDQKHAAIKQKLLEIKQRKRERDIQLSTKIATTRDRVWWMLGFYVTMGTVSAVRAVALRQISPLPLSYVPYALVPFLVGYQADFAYGSKSARINDMARHIREHEAYWFNEPLELPELLKQPYHELMEETNAQLRAMGKAEEKHWAT